MDYWEIEYSFDGCDFLYYETSSDHWRRTLWTYYDGYAGEPIWIDDDMTQYEKIVIEGLLTYLDGDGNYIIGPNHEISIN